MVVIEEEVDEAALLAEVVVDPEVVEENPVAEAVQTLFSNLTDIPESLLPKARIVC